MSEKYRFYLSNDDHPQRRIFETRYYAQKYVNAFYNGKRKNEYLIQKDPFTNEGYVIIFLEFI